MATSSDFNVPNFSETELITYAEENFDFRVISCSALPSYMDQNLYIKASSTRDSVENSNEYLLKVYNTQSDVAFLEAQMKVMELLSQRLHAPLRTQEIVPNKKGDKLGTIHSEKLNKTFPVRALTYIPGNLLSKVDLNLLLLKKFGKALAEMDNALQDVSPDRLDYYHVWDLKNAKKEIIENKHYIQDEERQQMIDHVLEYYNEIEEDIQRLPKTVIHCDPNDWNVLCDYVGGSNDEHMEVVGFIDFDHLVYTQSINEIAIATAYLAMRMEDFQSVIEAVVVSYHSIRPISALELDCLHQLICCRLSRSLCGSARRVQENPENADYILIHAGPARKLLDQMLSVPPKTLASRLKEACKLE
eukprot:CAMPEP_0115004854 /NCGR_PEP_ID=MMETSP0216-20121206/19498_1 /TAXON_ID=223996 /ORGANISM="Protocruzia adherens, Strain Boccale" /LENGTH=359 /DNA_ID=CAMNT_0002371017 /DNA_START=39 /DNA_END=1118 /DNA_ORIENTATION=+